MAQAFPEKWVVGNNEMEFTVALTTTYPRKSGFFRVDQSFYNGSLNQKRKIKKGKKIVL